MDNAGPLETVATDSYYYVTVPGADWGDAKSEEWLRYLNYPALEDISITRHIPAISSRAYTSGARSPARGSCSGATAPVRASLITPRR